MRRLLLLQLPGFAFQRLSVVAKALDEVFGLARRNVELVGEVADFVFLAAGDSNAVLPSVLILSSAIVRSADFLRLPKSDLLGPARGTGTKQA
jgi:hypothetical protein